MQFDLHLKAILKKLKTNSKVNVQVTHNPGYKVFFGAKGAFGSFYSIISVIGLTIGVAALMG